MGFFYLKNGILSAIISSLNKNEFVPYKRSNYE
jgi:hypothetical protein